MCFNPKVFVSILIMLDSALEAMLGKGMIARQQGFNPNYAG